MRKTARILVIDDDVLVRKSLTRLFLDMGHDVLSVENLWEGMEEARKGVDVVYLDLDLPDGNGLEAIDELTATAWQPEVIVITGMGSSYGAKKTMESNAWDYISKPASPQAVMKSLQSALEYRKEAKQEHASVSHFDCCGIIGDSAVMLRMLREIEKAAGSEAGVLLRGETGVGKELAARAIHFNSGRKEVPLVVVDCSNLTETLVESILYGHSKGAFTGAYADRLGLVAEANGGTLFLDEVGELPLLLQKTFLRVLQERSYRPVGSDREQSSDFRLVAATNRDLEKMVHKGTFRSDLLFRIRTIEIVVHPLRERGKDIENLVRHFINQSCDRYGLEGKTPSDELLRVAGSYRWPGNVREMANVMEAAVIHAGRDPIIYPKHLPSYVRLAFLNEEDNNLKTPEKYQDQSSEHSDNRKPRTVTRYNEYKAMRDREYFTLLMKTTDNDISRASRISGMSVPSIYRYLALAGIPTKNKL